MLTVPGPSSYVSDFFEHKKTIINISVVYFLFFTFYKQALLEAAVRPAERMT